MRTYLVLAAALLVVALATGTAQAKPKQVLALAPANLAFGPSTEQCPIGTAEFDLMSPSGAALGAGSACIQAIEPVGTTGQRARSILTFELAGGSLTIDTRLKERFIGEASLAQVAHGKVTAGTGRFADARGKLAGGGTVTFNADGSIDSNVVYVLVVKGAG
jgi:hypothetical protein